MSKYIPIHTYNLTFALGVYDSEDEAQQAYITFIENHTNYKHMKEDYMKKFNKEFDKEFKENHHLEDDDLCEFFEKWGIGFEIYEINISHWEIHFCNMVIEFNEWKHSLHGENHLESIMKALSRDTYIQRDFKIDIKTLALKHPVY